MFQLDEAMMNWRARLVQQGSVGPMDVDELESHLMDDIEQLIEKGLSVEEAFMVGVSRLGTPPDLAMEFGKINGARVWTRRLLWMLSGYVAISLVLSVYGIMAQWISAGAMVSGLVSSPGAHLLLRATLLGMAVLAVILVAAMPWGRTLLMRCGDRILFWGRVHPAMLMGAAFLLYIGARTSSLGRSVVVARLTSAEAMGQEAYANAYFGLAQAVIIPALILCLLGWTYRALHRPAMRELV